MPEEQITSPVKAIRAFCIECMGGSSHEVKNCTSKCCPLLPFRMGRNPYIKREMSDEQKAAAAERLANARRKDAISDDC